MNFSRKAVLRWCRRSSSASLLTVAMVAGCSEPTGVGGPGEPPVPYVRNARGVRVFGETRVPVILARFSNGPVSSWTREAVHARMFGGANGGLVNAPFYLASSERFSLAADVSPWVQTAVASGGNMNAFAVSAIQAADATVDFRRFDNDGADGVPNSGDDDGFVDGGVVLLHSSVDRMCFTSTPPPEAGPHPFVMPTFNVPGPGGSGPVPLRTNDTSASGVGIGVRSYAVMSVQHCVATASNASVLSHELGHLLFGLPDLYHGVPGVVVEPHEAWRARRWVVGCWDLMGAGGWGCGSGAPTLPAEFTTTLSAWSRTWIGWEQPLAASSIADTSYTLAAVGTGRSVLKIPVADSEYFLIEYRIAQSGDPAVPGSGVLIQHVDETLPLFPLTADEPRRYRVSLVEADDDSALVRIDAEAGNRGVSADAFGHTVTAFGTGLHSRALTTSGAALSFRLEQIALNAALRRATVRVIRVP